MSGESSVGKDPRGDRFIPGGRWRELTRQRRRTEKTEGNSPSVSSLAVNSLERESYLRLYSPFLLPARRLPESGIRRLDSRWKNVPARVVRQVRDRDRIGRTCQRHRTGTR